MSLYNAKKLDEYIKKYYIPQPDVFCAAMVNEDACEDRIEEVRNDIPRLKPNRFFAKTGAAKTALAESSARSLNDVLDEIGMSFSQCLFKHIDRKGLSNAEVYKKAGIDRKLFSKIQCNPDYKTTKKTAFALALALELNLDETKDLLARAGYAISPSSVFDLIIQFFIENGVYDIYTVNDALYEHNEPVLI